MSGSAGGARRSKMLLFWIWLIGGVVLYLVGGLPSIQASQDDEVAARELTVLYIIMGILWPVILVGGIVAFVAVRVMDFRENRKLKAQKL